MQAKMKAAKRVETYRPPAKLNCIARNCDDPEDQFEVFEGGLAGEIPPKAFIFEIRDDLVRRGYYTHSKTGNIYNVLGVVRRPDSDEVFVLYLGKFLSKDCPNGHCYWFRSLVDFTKPVDLPEKGRVPRFQRRGF